MMQTMNWRRRKAYLSVHLRKNMTMGSRINTMHSRRKMTMKTTTTKMILTTLATQTIGRHFMLTWQTRFLPSTRILQLVGMIPTNPGYCLSLHRSILFFNPPNNFGMQNNIKKLFWKTESVETTTNLLPVSRASKSSHSHQDLISFEMNWIRIE